MAYERISRRAFLKRCGAGAAIGLAGKGWAANGRRVIILGFDGMEPSIVDEMLARGELPNLTRLRGQGSYARLQSTTPPQSPVAWSSFATCKNPGGHNIFDFIRRDPKGRYGPTPSIGTAKFEHSAFGPDGGVAQSPRAETFRKGLTFWAAADGQGARCKVLNVPFAFPADRLRNGLMLCALGVPDLRGTTSTYFSLSDSFTEGQLAEHLSGGQRIKLAFDGADVTELDLPGPRDTRYAFNDPKAFSLARLRLHVDRKGRAGTAEVGGKKVNLVEGQWSEWLEWEFAVTSRFAVLSITRFFPLELGEQVRVYMTCQQIHPDRPYMPISHPEGYSATLAERYGLYKTIGWAYDTHALRQGDLHEEAFLEDVRRTMSWRERLALDELDRGEFDLLIAAWTATDRVGHMFWRYRDPKHPLYEPEGAAKYGKVLEDTYKKSDAIVGEVMARLRDGDLLLVLSDHGFESWRTGFNLNTWLRDNNYLAVNDPGRARQGFLMGLDWSRTTAYSIGLSSLYLNVKGRESLGKVPEDRAEAIIAEIRGKLSEVTDPATGNKVFSAVYTRQDYRGEAMDQAPDIVLAYSPYYQSAKDCAKGAVADQLFEPNTDKWSGEHAASDRARLPGVLFSNRPLQKTDPDIRDLGVSALACLGKDVPADFEGSDLFRA